MFYRLQASTEQAEDHWVLSWANTAYVHPADNKTSVYDRQTSYTDLWKRPVPTDWLLMTGPRRSYSEIREVNPGAVVPKFTLTDGLWCKQLVGSLSPVEQAIKCKLCSSIWISAPVRLEKQSAPSVAWWSESFQQRFYTRDFNLRGLFT